MTRSLFMSLAFIVCFIGVIDSARINKIFEKDVYIKDNVINEIRYDEIFPSKGGYMKYEVDMKFKNEETTTTTTTTTKKPGCQSTFDCSSAMPCCLRFYSQCFPESLASGSMCK